ncbi:guanylate kinase/L-type calcium channel region [Priestia megaterium]|uniref:guanylate kinase/L-type calcium channel region n=1 Tax=Priestia megaterium TaxID=1404 RepID=UPI000BEB4A2C|nr:guanylate kinase/L-type calcium channel region [Priestia megaterium]PED64036.1 guanylate kinase/L-type calcium channel region [Priestia megaterium]
MLYCLVGKTCSGKDTALKYLLKLGYKTIITYTSRPIREHEVDGVDYNFLEEKEFKELLNKFVAVRVFNDWYYGIDPKDIDAEEDQIIIIDPQGYRDLVETFGDHHITALYLDVPLEIRLLRGLNRKDKVDELFRRLQADEKDFIGLEEEVDYVIKSVEKDEAAMKILGVLRGEKK